MIGRVSMPVRAWWYRHIAKQKEVPLDVRKYLLKRGLKLLRKIENPTPEQQQEIATAELTAALGGEPGLLSESPGDLLGEAMTRLAQIPLEHCTSCHRPIFTHKAVKKDDRFYCPDCGGQVQ